MNQPNIDPAVREWLLDSDPAIRWQVLRDLSGAPEEQVAAERARVATEGLGAFYTIPHEKHHNAGQALFACQ